MTALPYSLTVTRPAHRVIADELPEVVAAAVIEFLCGPLIDNPHRVGKRLRGGLEGLWVARRGTYRVIYRIEEGSHEVVVLRIAHRARAYR